jgi:predicted nucleic acid-binding protein
VLTATDRHGAVLSACLAEVPEARGNLMHDLHTAALMREHGISRIITRDRGFHRFPFLDVVDPLREPTVG